MGNRFHFFLLKKTRSTSTLNSTSTSSSSSSFSFLSFPSFQATFSSLVLAGYPNLKDVHDAIATSNPNFLLTGELGDQEMAAESVAETFAAATAGASSASSSSSAIAAL